MNIDDMVMISIDDHVVEPPDLFEKYFPKSLKDQGPKLTANPRNPDVQAWMFQGVVVGSSGLNAVASWPKEEWGMDPTGYAEMRPGIYDMSLRVRDMDANGTLAATLFATFPGFAGTHLASLPDKKLSLAAALLPAPRLLFLDEPFEGIDAVASRQIKDLLQSFVSRGGTIFLTSHILEIVERLSTHIGVIADGRLVAQGPIEDLRAGAAGARSLEELFIGLVGGDARAIASLDWI